MTTGATHLLKSLGTRSTSLFPGASDTPTQLREPSLANTPLGNEVDLAKHDTSATSAEPSQTTGNGGEPLEDISAADYDPTQEGLADQQRRQKDREGMTVDAAAKLADGVREPVKIETQPDVKVVEKPAEDEWEEVEIEEDVEEEEDDMFAAFEGDDKPKKKRKIIVRRKKAGAAGADGKTIEVRPAELTAAKAAPSAAAVADNLDDTEGYYRITPGEVLDNGRYQVTITLGKGMFSAVVKAKVLKAVDQERRQDVVGKEVAIKVIRSQESMSVAFRNEGRISAD